MRFDWWRMNGGVFRTNQQTKHKKTDHAAKSTTATTATATTTTMMTEQKEKKPLIKKSDDTATTTTSTGRGRSGGGRGSRGGRGRGGRGRGGSRPRQMSSSQQQQQATAAVGGSGIEIPAGSQQMRQRRARILRDQAKERKEEQDIRNITVKSNKVSSTYMVRVYIVVGTALIVTILALLNYTRPSIIYNNIHIKNFNMMGKSISNNVHENENQNENQNHHNHLKRKKSLPYYIGTLYPSGIIVERDLPRFFRTYSIATPNNKDARMAVRKVVSNRAALRRGAGNLKIHLKAWDESHVSQMLERHLCGVPFNDAYLSTTSVQRREDLVMWCLLTTQVVEGFFLNTISWNESPFIFAKNRGMIVKAYQSDNKILHSYYLHPRNLSYDSTLAVLPSKVLTWIFDHGEDVIENDVDYQQQLQEYIYQLSTSQGNDDGKYLVLEEICSSSSSSSTMQLPPKRSVGKQCYESSGKCCYFVMPESEGGTFDDDDDDTSNINNNDETKIIKNGNDDDDTENSDGNGNEEEEEGNDDDDDNVNVDVNEGGRNTNSDTSSQHRSLRA